MCIGSKEGYFAFSCEYCLLFVFFFVFKIGLKLHRLFCPTFNLSQHCQGPAQSPQWANKAGSGENWFLWELSVAPGCGEGGELAPLRLWVGLRNFCVGACSWGSEASSLAEDASAVLAVAQVRAVWFFLSSLQILLCRLQ